MRYKAVIFDFDGTICDTGEGILKSAKFALDYYNIEAPEYTELTYFIGPPLLVTFQEKFGVDAATADKLVKKYRERYTNKGLLESKMYDGIKELLVKLKKKVSSSVSLLQNRKIMLRRCLTITQSSRILMLFAVCRFLPIASRKQILFHAV